MTLAAAQALACKATAPATLHADKVPDLRRFAQRIHAHDPVFRSPAVGTAVSALKSALLKGGTFTNQTGIDPPTWCKLMVRHIFRDMP
jgi:hypothetical protein